VTVLVAGTDCGAAAEQASKVANVDKVLCCDEAGLGNGLAENMSKAVAAAVAAGGWNSFLHIVEQKSSCIASAP